MYHSSVRNNIGILEIIFSNESKKEEFIDITDTTQKIFHDIDVLMIRLCKTDDNLRMIKYGVIEEFIKFLDHYQLPTIAIIDGLCCGVALETALSADIRICSNDTTFRFSEDLFAESIAYQSKIRKLLGNKFSMWQIGCDSSLTAEKALHLNLVNHTYNKKNLEDQAFQFAQSLIKGRTRETILAVKQCLNYFKKYEQGTDFNILIEEETKQFLSLIQGAEL